MKHEEIELRAEKLIMPIVEKNGFELVDMEYVKEAGEYYLRAYIDKPGGITINDCEAVSREFSDKLDEDDFIDDAYIMEVSSPGLGRPLKKEKDFARSIGEEIEVKTYSPKEFEFYKKKSKEFSGILKSYDQDSFTIADEDGRELVFTRSETALVRLALKL
ncbi:MAG: ribosome maturation factor RimP [Lachnospiraceae bacterium]|nr:ribosome maturation factor RimP [Lachnospiraceae bacterium]